MDTDFILSVKNLKQTFRVNRSLTIEALNNISFELRRGEIFGLVGESGCGKSTLAKAIMGIYQPTAGEICFNHEVISDPHIYRERKKHIQKNMQIIFQDSGASLNPYMTVEQILAEPFHLQKAYQHKDELKVKINKLLYRVGLDATFAEKYPSELSGGQRQRVSIARGISLDPQLVIADEPVSSLDVSIQAQIISLFEHLQQKHHFTFLFITHDLSMARYLCTRIAVMYAGKFVELAPTQELFENPLHPYTQALLSAIPVPDPGLERYKSTQEFSKYGFKGQEDWKERAPDHFVYE